jgi:YggT family protein
LRSGLADYLQSLILVYSILIFAWVLGSWVIATGRVPGWLFPILRFLEAVVGPFVVIFRRFIPPLGPLDLSPIIALLVLQLGGGLLVGLLRG